MKNSGSLMNQLRCDLKFVLWALVAVVMLAPVQVWLELREFEQFERGPDLGLALSGWLWVLMMMVSVVAVVLVVQKDTPAGPREFWLSRPVGRGVMLGSKLIVFGLFQLVLGMVWLMAPLLSGEGMHGGLFLLSFVSRAAWILGLALVLAAISFDLSKVLRNGLIVAGLFLVVELMRVPLNAAGFSRRSHDLAYSASLMAQVVFLFGVVGIVVRLYFAKSMRMGFILLMALFVVCVGINLLWPVNLMGDKMSESVKKEEGWDRVTVRLELREKDIERYQRNGSYGKIEGETVRRIPCSGLLVNLPEGYSIRDLSLSGEFEVDGKSVWSSTQGRSRLSTYLPSGALSGFENLGDVQEGHDFGLFEGEHQLRLPHLTVAFVPEDELKQWQGKLISFRGQARVEAVKTVRLARFRFGEDVLLDSLGMRLKLAFEGGGESLDSFRIEGQAWYPRPFFTALDCQGMRLFLVNEKEKTFVEVRSNSGASGPRGRISYWEKDFDLTRFGSGRDLRELPNREEWLRESFVYLYAPIPKGEFVVPVELEDFRLEDVVGPFDREENEG